jgi:hypothetical protein
MLQKAGVKPAEFENSGYDQAFAGQPSITRDQVVQHFQDALPKVEEKVLGVDAKPPISEQKYRELANAWENRQLTPEEMSQFNSYERFVNGERLPSDPAFVPTKFQQYTLPGGENYREVLLKLLNKQERDFAFEWFDPATQTSSRHTFASQAEAQAAAPEGAIVSQREIAERNPSFKSSHWDDPNVLAHLRMSDRVGDNGEKVLHLEELQSDWGQEGRKEGFMDQNKSNLSVNNEGGIWRVRDPQGQRVDLNGVVGFSTENQARNAIAENTRDIKGLPSAPYVTSTQGWTDLGLKRALKEAAEGGYDKMIWTPGAEQAKRYDLSQQIGSITARPTPDGKIHLEALTPDMGSIVHSGIHEPNKIDDVIGKELSDKIRSQIKFPKSPSDMGKPVELSGLDIQTGGEGMKSYYDKIVPKRLKELTKKLDPDAKIEPHVIRTPKGNIPAQSIRITPQMRERILKGQAAFQRGGSIVDRALNLTRGHQR